MRIKTFLLILSLSSLSGLPIEDAYERATTAFWEGRFQKVLSLLADLPEKQANRPSVHNLRSLALAELNRYDEALKANRRARTLDPTNLNYFYNAGMFYVEKGNLPLAEQNFLDGIKRFPESSIPYEGLGDVMFQQKRLKEAEKWLRKAVKLDPAAATAYVLLAKLFYAVGDQENLRWAASKAIELAPEYYLACYYYGKLLIDYQGKTTEGRQYIRKVTELSPRFLDGLKTWANILSREERWDEAAETYEKALTVNRQDSQLYYLLAIAYRKLGHKEKADRALSEYKKQIGR